MRPLVSVITGTRNRPVEIRRAITEVRAQTYRPLEHVIVSDGPDPALRDFLFYEYGVGMGGPGYDNYSSEDVPIIFAETGRVWSDEFIRSDGAAAFQVAQLLAHGPWQMWFSDDEEMYPHHIEKLMALIQETNSDFGYSRAQWYTNIANPRLPQINQVIGGPKPTAASITNTIYSTALLDYAKFETHRGRGTDWYQIEAWIAAGARFCFLDEVTFRHRADQVGGVDTNLKRQHLRGHFAGVRS